MGMFDWVHYNEHEDFQTKSLDNGLCIYRIEDGILWKEQAEHFWVDNDSPYGGYLDKRNPHWVPQYQYSGEIYFYRNTDKTYKVWEEYTAFVIDGNIIKVVESVEE